MPHSRPLRALLIPGFALSLAGAAASAEPAPPRPTVTLRLAPAAPLAPLRLNPITVVTGESSGLILQAAAATNLAKRYPMVVVTKDPSKFSMVVVPPGPGQYSIRLVPPHGLVPPYVLAPIAPGNVLPDPQPLDP